jgi:hypothetical protein
MVPVRVLVLMPQDCRGRPAQGEERRASLLCLGRADVVKTVLLDFANECVV